MKQFNEFHRCPVCGSQEFISRGETRDRHYRIPGTWRYGECVSCGLIQLTPMPSSEFLITLYPKDFYAYTKNEGGAWNVKSRFKSFLKGTIFRSFLFKNPVFSKSGRILDYGCGTGWSLLKFRDEGWECVGIEPSGAAADYGSSQYSLKIFTGTIHSLEQTELGLGHFDYIRSNHALEHDPELGSTVAKLAKILKPGGCVTIGIPNADGFAARLFGQYWWYFGAPVHTYCIGLRHISRILRSNGLDIEKVRFVGGYIGLLGSIQIFLNRNNVEKVSTDGFIVNFPPAILLFQLVAIIINIFRAGDAIEITARKNV